MRVLRSSLFTSLVHGRAAAPRALASAMASAQKPPLRGVVCDMDGTLVQSTLDFTAMYARCGVDKSQDILAVIASWPDAAKRAAAHATIEEIEQGALKTMALLPGAAELGAWCAARGLPLGLVTRNTASSVAWLHDKHWSPLAPFAPAVSRDQGLPAKPHPAALLHCAETWGVDPAHCAMVGDSPRDDVVAGRRAGFITVLIAGTSGRHGTGAAAAAAENPERMPHAQVDGLHELPAALEQLFLVPAPLA
jgi:beta-phosphoglucomutase-like phosphatase (HAD superfamily)